MFRPTQDPSRFGEGSSHTGLSPAAASLSRDLCWPRRPMSRSCNPGKHASRFGLVRVRSPLLAESQLISVPRGTEMFHFPRCRLSDLLIQSLMMPERHRIAPFGNPRIRGCLRLPADYRGLPRPSSPAIAKASVMRLNSLPAEIENSPQRQTSRACACCLRPSLSMGTGLCLGSVVILFCT